MDKNELPLVHVALMTKIVCENLIKNDKIHCRFFILRPWQNWAIQLYRLVQALTQSILCGHWRAERKRKCLRLFFSCMDPPAPHVQGYRVRVMSKVAV